MAIYFSESTILVVKLWSRFDPGIIPRGAGQVFTDLIGSMAQLLAQLAARVLVKALFGGIFGDGGTVPNRAFGGTVPNYADGGNVSGLGMAVAAAMKREGPQAVPIVASVGEEILSTGNGDAQFYRALKERGIWQEMNLFMHIRIVEQVDLKESSFHHKR